MVGRKIVDSKNGHDLLANPESIDPINEVPRTSTAEIVDPVVAVMR